jgi:hydroxypyruvate reductase/glycerate 2-kinase
LAILTKYRIDRPQAVLDFLQRGFDGHSKETPKSLPESCRTIVIGSNATAREAAKTKALELGYSLLDLGSDVEGESRNAALRIVEIVLRIRDDWDPVAPPACVIFGGETTVTLGPSPGRGGRNQEFVLATMDFLGREQFADITVLSAGTDGEDGPTDAAGAVASMETFDQASKWGLSIREHLDRHDAYPFFERTGGLLKTGLTGTNVMDLGIVLIQESRSGGIIRRRNATPD